MSELKPGQISWEDAAAVSEEYAEVLETEELGHELYVSDHGTIRWVANPEMEQKIMDEFGARDLNDLFMKGADKNDPRIRELYKHIGYSLFGFWEIFYWEVNNELAYQYMGRKKGNKKRIKFNVIIEIDNDTNIEDFMDCFESHLEFGVDEASNIEGAYAHKIISLELEE